MKLRQQLDGEQQDSLISRIASNPLERHKRITKTSPLSNQNRESEILDSGGEKVRNENQQKGIHKSQDINSSHQTHHTAPTLPTTTTSFPTSLSAIPTFSIFEDKKAEKETDKLFTVSASSFQIFEDRKGENEVKTNEIVGGSAIERMRNKEKERKTERDKEREIERERENVREKERERENLRVREEERERERVRVNQSERERKTEAEQLAQTKRLKTKDAHNHSDLDAMLLEMGVGDSEDGTINTRLARYIITANL